MYCKGEKGVFKAELRAAEVDPRFKNCRDAIAVLQINGGVSLIRNTSYFS